MYWRKGWDSNPRYPCRYAGFQDRCLKPLGHPSKPLKLCSYFGTAGGQKTPFATALLPNIFGALVYGGTQHIVNSRSGVTLHVRHQVAVSVHRDRDARMAQAFLHDLGMNVGREHVAGVAMPQPVQGDAPLLQKIGYRVGKAPGLQRRAIRLGNDMPAIVSPDAEP